MQEVFSVNNNFNVNILVNALEQYLQNQKGLITQNFNVGGKIVVQAKEESTVKKLLAQDKAVSIILSKEKDKLSVEITGKKWADKGAGMAIGLFLFWPALIPTAIGAYQQVELPKNIMSFIGTFIGSGNVAELYNTVAEEDIENNFCGNCGSEIDDPSAAFCKRCGAKL